MPTRPEDESDPGPPPPLLPSSSSAPSATSESGRSKLSSISAHAGKRGWVRAAKEEAKRKAREAKEEATRKAREAREAYLGRKSSSLPSIASAGAGAGGPPAAATVAVLEEKEKAPPAAAAATVAVLEEKDKAPFAATTVAVLDEKEKAPPAAATVAVVEEKEKAPPAVATVAVVEEKEKEEEERPRPGEGSDGGDNRAKDDTDGGGDNVGGLEKSATEASSLSLSERMREARDEASRMAKKTLGVAQLRSLGGDSLQKQGIASGGAGTPPAAATVAVVEEKEKAHPTAATVVVLEEKEKEKEKEEEKEKDEGSRPGEGSDGGDNRAKDDTNGSGDDGSDLEKGASEASSLSISERMREARDEASRMAKKTLGVAPLQNRGGDFLQGPAAVIADDRGASSGGAGEEIGDGTGKGDDSSDDDESVASGNANPSLKDRVRKKREKVSRKAHEARAMLNISTHGRRGRSPSPLPPTGRGTKTTTTGDVDGEISEGKDRKHGNGSHDKNIKSRNASPSLKDRVRQKREKVSRKAHEARAMLHVPPLHSRTGHSPLPLPPARGGASDATKGGAGDEIIVGEEKGKDDMPQQQVVSLGGVVVRAAVGDVGYEIEEGKVKGGGATSGDVGYEIEEEKEKEEAGGAICGHMAVEIGEGEDKGSTDNGKNVGPGTTGPSLDEQACGSRDNMSSETHERSATLHGSDGKDGAKSDDDGVKSATVGPENEEEVNERTTPSSAEGKKDKTGGRRTAGIGFFKLQQAALGRIEVARERAERATRGGFTVPQGIASALSGAGGKEVSSRALKIQSAIGRKIPSAGATKDAITAAIPSMGNTMAAANCKDAISTVLPSMESTQKEREKAKDSNAEDDASQVKVYSRGIFEADTELSETTPLLSSKTPPDVEKGGIESPTNTSKLLSMSNQTVLLGPLLEVATRDTIILAVTILVGVLFTSLNPPFRVQLQKGGEQYHFAVPPATAMTWTMLGFLAGLYWALVAPQTFEGPITGEQEVLMEDISLADSGHEGCMRDSEGLLISEKRTEAYSGVLAPAREDHPHLILRHLMGRIIGYRVDFHGSGYEKERHSETERLSETDRLLETEMHTEPTEIIQIPSQKSEQLPTSEQMLTDFHSVLQVGYVNEVGKKPVWEMHLHDSFMNTTLNSRLLSQKDFRIRPMGGNWSGGFMKASSTGGGDKKDFEIDPLFQLRGMDVFRTDRPEEQVWRHPILNEVGLRKVPTFVVNIMAPWANILVYFQMPAWVKRFEDIKEEEDDSEDTRALKRFLTRDDDYRNPRFKVLPSLVNGPLPIRLMAPQRKEITISATSVPVKWHFDDERIGDDGVVSAAAVVEVACDLFTSNSVRKIVSLLQPHVKKITGDCALVIDRPYLSEVNEPSACLGLWRMDCIDVEACSVLPAKREEESNNMVAAVGNSESLADYSAETAYIAPTLEIAVPAG